jgi:hypothetical protein
MVIMIKSVRKQGVAKSVKSKSIGGSMKCSRCFNLLQQLKKVLKIQVYDNGV